MSASRGDRALLIASSAAAQLAASLQLVGALPDVGPWAALPPELRWPRVGLGLALWALASLPCAAALESELVRLRLPRTVALLAPLGPPAILLTLWLARRSAAPLPASPPPARRTARPSLPRRAAGLLATVALLAALGWLLSWWSTAAGPRPVASADQRRANERLAWQRLAEIASAQQRFRARDRDGDGELTYARFVVHLHTIPDAAGVPQSVGLVDPALAFATAPARALDGYYYHDLHEETPQPRPPGWDGRYRALDAASEWAVVALPARYGVGGRLALLALPGGRFFAKDLRAAPLGLCPVDPLAAGWVSVRSPADLKPAREAAPGGGRQP